MQASLPKWRAQDYNGIPTRPAPSVRAALR